MRDLTLSQEYLICAVNEKGTLFTFNTEKLVCLVAAALLELQLEGCAAVDKKFITVTGPEEGPVRRAAAGLRDGLRSAAGQEPYRGMALDILGPAPAPVVKVNNRYRYRVTVIGRNDKTLRGLLSAFMKEFSRRPEHKALHIYTDCNLMD